VGGSRTAWCADYWRGECPVQGWWWRGSQKPNKPSKPPEINKNGEKTGGFAHVLAYKSLKTFFEEYTNFVAHYSIGDKKRDFFKINHQHSVVYYRRTE
jgi:hypothetical protein